MTCQKCGKTLEEGVKFCDSCGEKVNSYLDKYACKSCGATLLNNPDFCPNCGAKTEKSAGSITGLYTSKKVTPKKFLNALYIYFMNFLLICIFANNYDGLDLSIPDSVFKTIFIITTSVSAIYLYYATKTDEEKSESLKKFHRCLVH